MADDSIRPARAADLPAVVAVQTAAFHNDPLTAWAFPDPDLRPRRLDGLWTFMAGDIPDGPSMWPMWRQPGAAGDRAQCDP